MDKAFALEIEGDAPEKWETNVILKRASDGAVIEVNVPDDTEEVSGNAGDNQA